MPNTERTRETLISVGRALMRILGRLSTVVEKIHRLKSAVWMAAVH